MSDKIEVQNINAPHHVTSVDRAKYEAMRTALMGALTTEAPGMTAAEMKAELLKTLDPELFPGGRNTPGGLPAFTGTGQVALQQATQIQVTQPAVNLRIWRRFFQNLLIDFYRAFKLLLIFPILV